MDEMKMDRRVRRTKRQLRAALTSLMLEKDISAITVHEITELADVNRGTFYSHYKDVNDLLYQLEENLFIKLDEVSLKHSTEDTPENTYQFILEILSLVGSNADLCKALLCFNGDLNFQRRLSQALKDQFFHRYLALTYPTEESRLEYYCTFIVSGMLSITGDWLRGDTRDSPEALARICVDFISRGTDSPK